MHEGRADRWFENLYASAGEDLGRIPWAHLAPWPALVDWLERNAPANGTPALVVACGLGDDAEELARHGCAVEAFDLSPTAVATARRRFPGSTVRYRVADLFDLPPEWERRFALVVEVQTIQSLPPDSHRDAIAAIAACVAPGGRLLVRCAVRPEHEPATRRPWPLTRAQLRGFEDEGLEEVGSCPDAGGAFLHLDYRRPAPTSPSTSGGD